MSNSKSFGKDKEGEGTNPDEKGDGKGEGSGSGSDSGIVGESGENDENTTDSVVPGQGGLLPGLTGNLT